MIEAPDEVKRLQQPPSDSASTLSYRNPWTHSGHQTSSECILEAAKEVRLGGIGWLAFLGVVFGSAFDFKLANVSVIPTSMINS